MDDLLAFQKLQKQITAYIRDPEQIAPPENVSKERLDVYKTLVFGNILETLTNVFPICQSILSDEQFVKLARAFFKNSHSDSPFFQDIPKAFLDYLFELELPDDYPEFLYELAHYEWVELALEILNNPRDKPINVNGSLLKEHPVISSTAWVLQYRFPVHKIGKAFQPKEQASDPTFLIVYRNQNNKIEFMQISVFTAHLINLLLQNENLSGEDALTQLAEAAQAPDKKYFMREGLNDLVTLKEHSIILGTRRLS